MRGKKMRAAVFYGPGDLRIEEVPDPTPNKGEIVVDVEPGSTTEIVQTAGRSARIPF